MFYTYFPTTLFFVFVVIGWFLIKFFDSESTELTVSSRREFFSTCYENENLPSCHKDAVLLEMKLRAQGKWIERDLSKGRPETDYSKVPKTKKGFEHIANIPNRNHMVEGYTAFKESKKERIAKPISLIPETTTHYDIELVRNYEKAKLR